MMGPLLGMGPFRFMFYLCAYMEPMPAEMDFTRNCLIVKPSLITNMLLVMCLYSNVIL